MLRDRRPYVKEILYLGPEASYTHQAALQAFPEHCKLSPYPTIASIFERVRAYSLDHKSGPNELFGVVPVENSTNGPVAATLDQLTAVATKNRMKICGEVRVPVRHCLVGHAQQAGGLKRTASGTELEAETLTPKFGTDPLPDLSHVKELHTHPQAWGQCTKFMKALGLSPPGAKPTSTATASTDTESVNPDLKLDITCHDASSTSSAAALAASDASGKTAAISSQLAAEAHGAEILLEGLEDSASNVTRFFILQPRLEVTLIPLLMPHLQDVRIRRKCLITFILTPNRDGSPGGLSEALGAFAKHQLSLTSINARPRGGQVAFEYTFIVEIDLGESPYRDTEKMIQHTDASNAALTEALDDLKGVVAESTALGLWLWRVDE